jgi:hypothetical protein
LHTGQSNTVGYNSIDGQPMPELAQPLPGKVLAFSPEGAWGDAQPSIHYGGWVRALLEAPDP